MKPYSNKIALVRNSRGIYGIDTSMGCASGMANSDGGCYNDCYAAKSAKLYGYDFSKTVLRYFESRAHERKILAQIDKCKLDFIRIGCSGDPSENWQHCIDILKVLARCNKEIVIITKHWNNLTDVHLQLLSTMNVCINTSASAMDKVDLLNNSLNEYQRIKPYCKSVLRIVSCDFNIYNCEGVRMAALQHELFKNQNTLDTVFRPSKNNPLVLSGVINTSNGLFLGKKTFMSKFNRKTFTGNCSNCHEMCGQKMKSNYEYPNKRKLTIQKNLFDK